MKSIKLLLFILLLSGLKVSAQHEEQIYIPVPDPLIQKRIDQWQDIKFGLLMHWGPYSQWGIVESWSICPEDEDWCVPDTVKDCLFHTNLLADVTKEIFNAFRSEGMFDVYYNL